MKVIIINGPNLNLLEKRSITQYGGKSFDDFFKGIKHKYKNIDLSYFQSNVEGELIDKLQIVGFTYDYIIFNPGGYTHYSVAISDCVSLISTPVIEVHISNIYSREDYRKKSLISKHCIGCIVGFGLSGYVMAIDNIIQ
tara:strand:- start:695 stop:1111 length:417 start_codon:yes stop_codon:yes gene_type:complete